VSKLDTLPPLREIISQHDLRAEKSFGQNFLLDLNITAKIARQAGSLEGKHAIEIGPGPGGLTRALLETEAASVTAIEFDPRCITALHSLETAAHGRLNLIHGDALEADLLTLTKAPRVVAANLPYNIATPLLVKWLKDLYTDPTNYDALILMFQKEVAERIVATPNDKTYGRLAILTQWLTTPRMVMTLPPQAFTPAPKVHSSVVLFKPKQLSNKPKFETVEKLTAQAFGQRRKMIRQSLKPYVSLFEELGIDPTLRAEDLSVEQFIQLARRIDHTHPHPQP
jgi:16S rRNA (adenine1518-N6/adenine1519-N6)-dimethyltransferase